ncbi:MULTISPECIES: MFS transporter [Actibacterium]|uniref:MFS family permease n=1 Tax=Actibacterium naphthalenivorans TaxID=1614693 RepID=A0A840CGP7_9RHOB|nr:MULTISPECIES: MFS transporter [Actibacterium]MBB4023983.1 MFS family permease [Actibacterium naphthalenivorans]
MIPESGSPHGGDDGTPPQGFVRPSLPTLFLAIVPPLFMGISDQTIVSTALPSIIQSLGGFDRMALVVIAYLAAVTVSAPLYGRLGDALGRRRMMCVALCMAVVGSAFCSLSVSFEMLVASRFLQGLGGGGLIGLAQALLGQYVGPRARAKYQGYLATIAMVASTFGPVAGGLITGHFGWRWIFALNIPLGILAFVLVMRLPPRQTPREKIAFDYPGFLLFAGFVATALTIIETVKRGAAVHSTLFLLVAIAGAILMLLVLRERRAAEPLFPGDLLGRPSIFFSMLLAMCHGGLYVSLLTFIPIYFALGHGVPPRELGLLMLPVTLGIGSGAFVTGKLINRTGRTTLYPAISLSLASALLFLASVGIETLSPWQASIYFAIVCLLLGSVMGVVQITVQTEAGIKRLGIATASVVLSRSLGAASGTAFAGLALALTLDLPAGASATSADISAEMLQPGFHNVFRLLGCIAAAGAAMAFLIPRRRI